MYSPNSILYQLSISKTSYSVIFHILEYLYQKIVFALANTYKHSIQYTYEIEIINLIEIYTKTVDQMIPTAFTGQEVEARSQIDLLFFKIL